MDLSELIKMAGGENSLGELAGSLGLNSSSTADLIGALSPALMKGMAKQGDGGGSLDALKDVLIGGSHQKYIDQPELMKEGATRDDGNKILGHLFGEKQVSRNVATKAAESTGIDASVIKSALPMIAGLAMAALSKKTTETSGGSGGLGDLLGGLMGGAGGETGLDDLLGMAKKLF